MQVETGSAITWKYPSVVLKGDNSVGEFYSVALTNNYQQVLREHLITVFHYEWRATSFWCLRHKPYKQHTAHICETLSGLAVCKVC